MELRQLEYLVAVAEEAGFTRAAQRVRISQSGVSAQVRQLEREVGAALVDRSSRAVRLTGAGQAALPHARAALAAAAALREAVSEVTGVVRGRLAVGMVSGCTVTGLFDALAAFRRAHPGVSIALAEDSSAALTARVRAGEADLALVGAAGAVPAGLDALPLYREGLAAMAPPGHPLLAGRDAVTLDGLAGYPLVCMPPGTGVRAALDEACAARGTRLDIALEASAPAAAAGLAARGLGVAVLSGTMAAAHAGPGLRAVPVADAAVPALLALVWKPSPGPALAALLRHCREAFPAPAPARLTGSPGAKAAASVRGTPAGGAAG